MVKQVRDSNFINWCLQGIGNCIIQLSWRQELREARAKNEREAEERRLIRLNRMLAESKKRG